MDIYNLQERQEQENALTTNPKQSNEVNFKLQYNYINIKMLTKLSAHLAIILMLIIHLSCGQSAHYNESLCTDIEIDSFHFFINEQQSSANIQFTEGSTTFTYNLCKQVEVYCRYQNAVLSASMVSVDPSTETCTPYIQSSISYLDGSKATSGLKVEYLSIPVTNISQSKVLTFSCKQDGSQTYCPQVEEGIMWDYFYSNVITFTIIIEVIGVILMVLGIYIYRGSIVLIGCATVFIILTMIESLFVYLRGVPSTILENVLILTIVTSFIVGYVLGYFPKAGVFCMGMWIGFVISLTLNNIAFYYIETNPSNLTLYIVLPILSIGFGILTQYIKKAFIIFASSLIGSYLCLRALSWNLGAFPNQFTLSKQYHLGLSGPVPWQYYLYVIALIILTLSSRSLQKWLFEQKMKNTNQTTDIEQHFDNMENTLKKQREQLIQIKSVFQAQPKQPRVLKKAKPKPQRKLIPEKDSAEAQEESESAGHSGTDSIPRYKESESEESGSEGQPEEKKDLKRNLLEARQKRR